MRSPYAQASPRQSTSGRPKSGSNRGTRASAEAEFVFTKRGNSVQGPRDSPNQMSASARISSAELASGLPDDLPNEDIMPQALEILASLASLGISENVRGKVQAALSELHQQTAAGRPGSMLAPRPETSPAGPASLPPAGSPQHKRLEQLEAKLEMARSIMKKLYYKNVNLEKELKLLQASATQLAALDSSSMPGSPGPPSPNGPGPSGLQLGFPPSPSARAGAAGSQLGTAFRPESAPVFSPTSQAAAGSTTSSPVIQSLYDKDSTIAELQAALDASRRRAAMLETQLSTTTKSVDNASVREAMAQSALLSQKYRQIRQEYHQLLSK